MSLTPFVLVDAVVPDDAARLPLSDDTRHHLDRVLRVRDGAAVEACDGAGRVWAARREGSALAPDAAPRHIPRPKPRTHVLQAVPKSGKLEAVVRVLVELGVDRVTPIVTARTVVRIDGERARRVHARCLAVARSATEQARRAWLPIIAPPLELDDVVTLLDAPGVLAHVDATEPLERVLVDAPWGHDEVTIAVGPEGGWETTEVETLVAAGLRPAHLGTTVLRTEHAAAAVLAIVRYATGAMGGNA